jgi:hypothetical protein
MITTTTTIMLITMIMTTTMIMQAMTMRGMIMEIPHISGLTSEDFFRFDMPLMTA